MSENHPRATRTLEGAIGGAIVGGLAGSSFVAEYYQELQLYGHAAAGGLAVYISGALLFTGAIATVGGIIGSSVDRV